MISLDQPTLLVPQIEADDQARRPVWRLHRRNAVLMAIVAAAALVGVRTVHDIQIYRLANRLLDEADEARSRENFRQAARRLQEYVALHPEDNEARIRLALDQSEFTPDGLLLEHVALEIESLLVRFPERRDLRRKAAELMIIGGRYADALMHLDKLLKADPHDPEVRLLVGRCSELAGARGRALKMYREIVREAPDYILAWETLARTLRSGNDRPDEATAVLDRMLAANPENANAYLARARHFRDCGDLVRAGADALKAFELGPEDVDTLCVLAELDGKENGPSADGAWADQRVRIGQAIRSAISRTPKDARLYVAMAHLESAAGHKAEARQCLEDGISKAGRKGEVSLCLADLLLEEGRIEDGVNLIRRLAQTNADPAMVRFIESRVAMAQGDWSRACQLLFQLRNSPRLAGELALQVELGLVRSSRNLRHETWRLQACRRAAQLAPRSLEARLELAAAAEDQGFLEEAVGAYRSLLNDDARSAWRLARDLVLLNLRRPAEEQNWGEFDDLVRSHGGPAENADWALLNAEGLTARGELGRAESALAEGCGRFPDSVDLRCAWAGVLFRNGHADQGVEIIERALSELGLKRNLVLMGFRLRSAAGAPDQEQAAEQLARRLLGQIQEVPEGERAGLLEACAAGCQDVGALALAARLWDELAALTPQDVTVRRRQLSVALEQEDFSAAQRHIDQLRRLEGERGMYWRLGTALRLVYVARRGKTDGLKRAIELLQQIGAEFPVTPGLLQVRAEIAELEGDLNSAVGFYRDAMEAGARSPDIFFRTAKLLSRLQRFTEVEQVLAQFTPDLNQPSTMELGRLSAEAALGRGYLESAATRAKNAVNQHATTFEDYIWLAAVLDASRRPQEAEAAVRKACQMAPDEPAARLALVEWLLRHDRKTEAESELEAAVAVFPEPQASLAAARGSVLLGRLDEAATKYESLLESAADDPVVAFAAADFFIRLGDLTRAEPLWRQICEAAGRGDGDKRQLPVARRALAACMLGRGPYREVVAALDLLRLNAEEVGESLADLKLKARLLALLPSRQKQRQAVAVLSSLGENGALSPEDGFLLARLVAGLGERSLALSEIQSLLVARPNDPNLLAFGIGQALEPDLADLDAADKMLERLIRIEPASFRALAFRVRLLSAENRVGEARTLLREGCLVEGDPGAPRNGRWFAEAAVLAGGLAAQVARSDEGEEAEQFWEDAERYWRDSLSQAPQSAPELVKFLAARGRREEALQLAELHVDDSHPVELAGALVTAMQNRPAGSSSEFRRARAILQDKLLKADSSNAQLVFSLGNLAQVEGRYDDAERLYRRTLELAPEHILAANNLACSIALRGGELPDALKLVDRAIESVGPLPVLLDTRAVVYIRLGRPADAINDLEAVLAETKTQSAQFHLCQALLASRKWSAAQNVYRNLVSAGLGAENLYPLERPAWEALQKEMQSR